MNPVDIVIGVVALIVCAVFTFRAWRASSRVAIVAAFGDVVGALVVARLLLTWTVVPVWAWLVPIALVAAGVVGAVLRGPGLPFWRHARRRWPAIVGLAIRSAILVLLGVLVLWP